MLKLIVIAALAIASPAWGQMRQACSEVGKIWFNGQCVKGITSADGTPHIILDSHVQMMNGPMPKCPDPYTLVAKPAPQNTFVFCCARDFH
jgi:hypothetical protein